jgi:hypothetical protein
MKLHLMYIIDIYLVLLASNKMHLKHVLDILEGEGGVEASSHVT